MFCLYHSLDYVQEMEFLVMMPFFLSFTKKKYFNFTLLQTRYACGLIYKSNSNFGVSLASMFCMMMWISNTQIGSQYFQNLPYRNCKMCHFFKFYLLGTTKIFCEMRPLRIIVEKDCDFMIWICVMCMSHFIPKRNILK